MSGRGNFFAVDRRCAEEAAKQRDGINLGTAYLVLARYASGRNHSSTKAGMTAIHTKLGLSRGRADAALKALENAGLLTPPSRAGTRKLVAWGEYQTGALTARQQAVLARVKAKADPILSGSDPDYQTAYALSQKGALTATKATAGKPRFKAPEPEYLFLPNTLVDGFREGDHPLARLRQIGDARALRTLLAAYDATDLPEKGGIPRAMIRQTFSRVEAGRWGSFRVWAFAHPKTSAEWSSLTDPFDRGDREEKSQQFWNAWQALCDAGLIEFVSYLCESANTDAQPIHALADRGGTEEERKVTVEAHRAGLRMMSEAQIDRAAAILEASRITLCPVRSHAIDVQLVGIARPVHRANTSKTGAWAHLYIHEAVRHAEVFANLCVSRTKSESSPVVSTMDQ
ncbi:hypothetical protein [Methylobacterium sp. J-068]|uniref:hypothetical protein n=1 Tax=Methylobacterium sp. J-068 TaxID=2836649 RepID=UPI001FB944F1|nr:hypothetical protein [Methylobacterium sp. J-068]MCJ2036411.1 hypothetical protein [Methylobacterium sp. J-068]